VLYAGLATREAVGLFLGELSGTGNAGAILLSGVCLAVAQEVPVRVQQMVIRALLALPNYYARGVHHILEMFDPGVVT
jgi:hypothetical protein